MKLTKLRAAPVRQAEVPPCAFRRFAAARTASQLIRGVRWTRAMCDTMASVARRRASQLLCVVCGAFSVMAPSPIAHAEADKSRPAELIGTWQGTSTCTDLVAAPACRNETVVYVFTAGSRPGTVHWLAEKLVAGQREAMGEMELEYDPTASCWKGVFNSPRVKVEWRLVVNGWRLSGSGRLLPGNETIRKVDLRKD